MDKGDDQYVNLEQHRIPDECHNRPKYRNLLEDLGQSGCRTMQYRGWVRWESKRGRILRPVEIISDVKMWSYSRKSAELAVSLRGEALGVLATLDPTDRLDYNTLTRVLQSRFGPERGTEFYKSHLLLRKRKPGKSLAELAQDIRRLVINAYPRATRDMCNDLAITAFTEAFVDRDLELAVVSRRQVTLEDAVQDATTY
jgi:hypothetical protein